jgi:Flp pilus assembly protein TadG
MNIRRLWPKGEQGSQIVEFGLVLAPMLGLIFLLVDFSWVLFARATIQFAAREGVRYAITGQTSGSLGQDASIEDVVVNDGMGFITSSNVTISYFNPSNGLAPTNSNAGGNVVQISVTGVNVTPIAPFLHSNSPISMTATSSAVVEPSPNGIPPAR